MPNDPELEEIRAAVGCPLLLERHGYQLDKQESTRRNPKYRRGAGEIVIVNHDGQGWWDPNSTAKGDVFGLAQHLDPSLNFGQVRRDLRLLVGIAPTYVPAAPRERTASEPPVPPELRWAARPKPAQGTAAWRYLTQARGLPPEMVAAVTQADNLREGPHASAWFAHRDGSGRLTGIEMRGPSYRGFSSGGDKSLFRLQLGTEPPSRLAVLEAPIKAIAFAAIEGRRTDTLYVATAGGMGPGTLACLQHEIGALARHANALVIAASDADAAGERYAATIAEMAAAAGVRSERATPTGGKDWDEVLKSGGAGRSRGSRLPSHSRALAAVQKALRRPELPGPPPWMPRPVAMAERMEAVQTRAALAAAERLAEVNRQANPEAAARHSPQPGVGS